MSVVTKALNLLQTWFDERHRNGQRSSEQPIDAARAAIAQDKTYEAGARVRVSRPNLILSPPLIITETKANTLLPALDASFAAVGTTYDE